MEMRRVAGSEALSEGVSEGVSETVSRRQFLVGVGCVAALSLVDGCGEESVTSSSATAGVPEALQPNMLNHFIVAGQSLSQGLQGSPPLSTVQPFNNKMFTYPVLPDYAAQFVNYNALTKGYSGLAFRPLLNGPAPDKRGLPEETMANGFADSLTSRYRLRDHTEKDFQQLLSCSGVEGAKYIQVAGPTDVGPDGSAPFQEMMSQVALGRSLAMAAGLGYNVPAMLLIHGESDSGNGEYAINLKTWQSDMQKGVNAITGGKNIIPMIAAQTQYEPASAVRNGDDMPFVSGAGSLGTMLAATDNPGLICVACPEYMMEHVSIHMTANGYRHLGEMMAKAAYQIVVEQIWWWPLMPLTTTRSGDVIKIEYRVPFEPLVLDTSWVTDPGNYGFHFLDKAGTEITGVEVTGVAEISIQLSQASAGGMLSYGLLPNAAGPVSPGFGLNSGPRGCVRDSDPTISYYKDTTTGKPYPLQNYSITWQATV